MYKSKENTFMDPLLNDLVAYFYKIRSFFNGLKGFTNIVRCEGDRHIRSRSRKDKGGRQPQESEKVPRVRLSIPL